MDMDAVHVLFDWLENFRLSMVSHWPAFHSWKSSLSLKNGCLFFTRSSRQMWWWLKRQPILSQIFLLIIFLLASFAILSKLYVRMTRGVCKSKARMDGKTVLITGANNGIGLETARDLAGRGARIILACRNMERGVAAAKDILETTGNPNLVVRKLDLSSMATVRKFAEETLETEERLDVMVLNAGLALTKKYMTEDNLELHMAANHFGHFLLTILLLPLLCQTSIQQPGNPVRIIVVSSLAHWWGKIEIDNLNSERTYEASKIYSTTKLANMMFAFELSRRLKAVGYNNITVNALHPGAVQTGLFRNIPYYGWLIKAMIGLLYYSPKEGAQTSIHLAVSEDVASTSGEYFADCKRTQCSAEAKNEELAGQLWEKSLELVDLEPQQSVIPPLM